MNMNSRQRILNARQSRQQRADRSLHEVLEDGRRENLQRRYAALLRQGHHDRCSLEAIRQLGRELGKSELEVEQTLRDCGFNEPRTPSNGPPPAAGQNVARGGF